MINELGKYLFENENVNDAIDKEEATHGNVLGVQ